MTEFDAIEVSEIFPVKPDALFKGWLDSKEHSAYTGGNEAEIDPRVGGSFTAWGGYISGKTLELDPPRRILQEWRTQDFASEDEASLIEIRLTPEGRGTRLTIKHTRIPKGQGEGYKQGWIDFYFKPMREHFKDESKAKSAPLKKK